MMYPLVLDLADGVPGHGDLPGPGILHQARSEGGAKHPVTAGLGRRTLTNAARTSTPMTSAFGALPVHRWTSCPGADHRRRKPVARPVPRNGSGRFAKKRGLNRRSGPPVHDDLVQRQFSASVQVWLADITEHHTDEGKFTLCAIKDVYSNRIVGYSIDSRMKFVSRRRWTRRCSTVATIVHSTGCSCLIAQVRPCSGRAKRITRIDGRKPRWCRSRSFPAAT